MMVDGMVEMAKDVVAIALATGEEVGVTGADEVAVVMVKGVVEVEMDWIGDVDGAKVTRKGVVAMTGA